MNMAGRSPNNSPGDSFLAGSCLDCVHRRSRPGDQRPPRLSLPPRLPAVPPAGSPAEPGAPLLPCTVPCAGIPGDEAPGGCTDMGSGAVPGWDDGVDGRCEFGPMVEPGTGWFNPVPAG